jgi:hypothetical protein
MPAICWTRYFMEAQGYQVQDNILFQDNKSAILWEKMEKLWAASIRSMSIFGISLLPIASTRATYHWSGVWPETWSETSWPNPYKVLCSVSSETKSWEWFLHRIQDQEKPKRRLMSCILILTSLRKAKNSNLVEERVQYIIWSHLRKKDGTTGVCWEKWHERRTDAWRISHVLETSHLNATSKSQASNKQDPFSLL